MCMYLYQYLYTYFYIIAMLYLLILWNKSLRTSQAQMYLQTLEGHESSVLNIQFVSRGMQLLSR